MILNNVEPYLTTRNYFELTHIIQNPTISRVTAGASFGVLVQWLQQSGALLEDRAVDTPS